MSETSNLPESAKQVIRRLLTRNRKFQETNRELKKKVREISLVHDMSSKLNETSDVHEFYSNILQMALKISNSEIGGILLFNPLTKNLRMKVSIGEIETGIIKWLEKVPAEIMAIISRSKVRELIFNDPLLSELQKRDPLIKSALFFPLFFSREHYGLGFVMHRHEGSILHSAQYGEDIHFLAVLTQQASLIAELNQLKFEYQSQHLYLKTITALTEAIDAKDMYTAGHSQRVAEISATIAYELGLTQKEIDTIHYGALLHDIGKIGIPESILNKKGKLTKEEFFNIKRHPVIGTNILRSIDFLDDALHIVRYHHERYDGKGYPDGLKHDNIPFMARIVCIADAWDAMTSNRSYREALPIQVAIEELEKNAGTQFDPVMINTLERKSFAQLQVI